MTDSVAGAEEVEVGCGEFLSGVPETGARWRADEEKLMKNLMTCQLEPVHYQLRRKKAPVALSRAYHAAMSMHDVDWLQTSEGVTGYRAALQAASRRGGDQATAATPSQASYDEFSWDSAADEVPDECASAGFPSTAVPCCQPG
jgi:hypothetical protein